MRRLFSVLGRRLVFRLYIIEAILFASVAVTIFIVGRGIMQPAVHATREEPIAWSIDELLKREEAPSEVQPHIDSLRDRVGASVTIFAPDGRVVATTAASMGGPLDAVSLERLARGDNVMVSRHLLAVGHAREGRLRSYAVIDWEPEQPLWRAAIIIASALVLLGIGSVLLARRIAKPLEQLAEVSHAFGLGDLRVRASTCRSDEIGDVGRAFNEMADRIETLRRSEKELLANVSHELRTPLARIRVGVELAEGGDAIAVPRYLTGIADDLNEIENLLGDIITAARLDLTHERANDPYPPLRLTPIPLASLVEALVRRFRDMHAERAVQVTIDGDPTITVDRVMFKHALSNVLDNAHKYSQAGQPIEISLRVENGSAVVDVRDHGQGVDPDDVPQVFTPFFRADRSRRRETGGVGLGLTLAKRIVEAHGGTIGLESRKGEGTTVRIVLPLSIVARLGTA